MDNCEQIMDSRKEVSFHVFVLQNRAILSFPQTVYYTTEW